MFIQVKQKKTGLQVNLAITGKLIDDTGNDEHGIRRGVGIPANWGMEYKVHVTGAKKWLARREKRQFRYVFLRKLNLHHKYDFSVSVKETLCQRRRGF